MIAALAWILSRLFTPPEPPPLRLPLPARLLPQVEQYLGDAIQAAYLLGAFNGAAVALGTGLIVGVLLGFGLLALWRLLADLLSLVRSGSRLADALASVLSRQSSPPHI